MNIQQLRYVSAVMEAGSFSAAARHERVSVQAVSKALGELEHEFGQSIFVRSSSGATPTAFGQELRPYVQHAVDAIDTVATFAEVHADGGVGPGGLRIRMAVPCFTNSETVCLGLERLIARRLHIPVRVSLCDGEEGVRELARGAIDVLITLGTYENPAFESSVVGTLPAGVFFAANHPLAGRDMVSLADLAPYPVCYVAGIDDFNETIVNLYLKNGLASPVARLRTIEDFMRHMRENLGFCMGVGIPSFSVMPRGRMALVKPSESIPVPVCASRLKGRTSKALRLFDRFVLDEFSAAMSMLGD